MKQEDIIEWIYTFINVITSVNSQESNSFLLCDIN